MAVVLELRCLLCGRSFDAESVRYTCPECGPAGTLDVLYDYDNLRHTVDRNSLKTSAEYSMWRYRDLLPLEPSAPVPPLRVGFTPLYAAPRLAQALGTAAVWVKDDGQNPTASLKDRASALIVARACQQNIDIVTTASTGNAAAALAGVAASVAMHTLIFVPANAPEAKIAQLLVYGATVLLVDGTYDQAFDLCLAVSEAEGWYCRNTGVNPYTSEGKKTVAFEIAEQMDWNPPDVMVVSVGDGNIIASVYKGFYDLQQLGWIERIPRLIGVQSSGSAPLVDAWHRNISAADMRPVEAHSIADSIVAGLPRDRTRALRAVRDSGGAFVAVPDDAILAAIPQFARLTGVFAEPASAASWVGAQYAREQGFIHPDDRVLILSTGSGLKDVARARQSVNETGIRVQPTIESVRAVLRLDNK